MQAFRARKTLQLASMFRVAGEEENLVVFREGSDGLDGGGASGGVHVGEGVVEEGEVFSGRWAVIREKNGVWAVLGNLVDAILKDGESFQHIGDGRRGGKEHLRHGPVVDLEFRQARCRRKELESGGFCQIVTCPT